MASSTVRRSAAKLRRRSQACQASWRTIGSISAARRGPSATAMTENPVSGMSSQGWTGNSETARTPGRAWRRLASAISPAIGWSWVPWPSAGTSMGARAKSVTGRISPRTVRRRRAAALAPVS